MVPVMPDPIMDDNFDLHDIQMEHRARMPDEVLHSLRMTMSKASWEDVPKDFDLFAGTLKLSFHDVDGDQNHLDGHRHIQDSMTDLVLHVYNSTGKAVRAVHFSGLAFSSGKQAFAYEGAAARHAYRLNEYTYKNRRELKLA